jgi:hypothetical protein
VPIADQQLAIESLHLHALLGQCSANEPALSSLGEHSLRVQTPHIAAGRILLRTVLSKPPSGADCGADAGSARLIRSDCAPADGVAATDIRSGGRSQTLGTVPRAARFRCSLESQTAIAVPARPCFSTASSPASRVGNSNRGVKDLLATTVKDVMAPYTEARRYVKTKSSLGLRFADRTAVTACVS